MERQVSREEQEGGGTQRDDAGKGQRTNGAPYGPSLRLGWQQELFPAEMRSDAELPVAEREQTMGVSRLRCSNGTVLFSTLQKLAKLRGMVTG